MKRHNVTENVHIHKGFYSELLKGLKLDKKASFVWIDCDLYESTKDALFFIKDHIQQGTVISFDDWYCNKGSPSTGEQLAFREFINDNDVNAIPFYDFRTFILDKKKRN